MEFPPIYFVAGLPRSGSTLLMNLLGQNPAHHVTPTNGFLDLLISIRDTWAKLPEFRSQGLEKIEPRVSSMMRAMIEGFYRDEINGGKIIFDKARGWLAYIEMMEAVLARPVKVIVTVRDIRAIAASFEKLHRQNPLLVDRPENYPLGQTVEGRTAMLLSEGGMLGLAISRLRDAMRRRHGSQILLIPYNRLCRDCNFVLNSLHEQLGLPPFRYNPEHVVQLTQEDDVVHGVTLHKIRPKVEEEEHEPWKDVLPDALANRLAADFADIQALAQVS